MARGGAAFGEKPLYWVGFSRKDLLAFPEASRVVENHAGDTWRAVYTVRFAKAIYVLHAFQKKSPKGVKTAQRDADLVSERLRQARRDYEERYGDAEE